MSTKTWVILVLVVLVLVGAYQKDLKLLFDKGPTNEETQQVFQGYFQKSIPIDWAGSMMGGSLQTIAITNVNRGESIKKLNGGTLPPPYNSTSQDCWPVTMHVKGAALANMIFNTQIHNFEEDASFKLCKTYENNWLIDTGGRIMTGGM